MLKKLTIDGLRGATHRFELPFDPSKRISIIYGENGCGKSTVCDALELIAEGTVTSLNDRGLGPTARYWVSTGRKAADVLVSLETTKGKWVATLAGKNVWVKPDTGHPRLSILRRKEILTLVCASPSSRFEVIRPFIDIEAIELAEKSLNDLIKSEKQHRITAIAIVEENLRVIDQFWKQAKSPPPNALTWAKAEAKKDFAELEKELVLLTKIARALTDIATSNERWSEVASKVKGAQVEEKKSADALQKAKAEAKGGEADVVELLQSASELLHDHPDPETCPLCESQERVKGLVKRVDQRLGLIGSVTKAASSYKSARALLDRLVVSEEEERKKLKALLYKFSKSLALTSTWPKDVTPPAVLITLGKRIAALVNADDIEDAEIPGVVTTVLAFQETVTKAMEQRHGQKAVHTQLKNAVETYEENYNAQLELDKLIPQYDKVLATIADERRAFVDSILQRIAKRVGELYEEIHPGEGLNRIELQLDPAKRASLEIGADFPGAKDAPPQAFFSDSHLDTLGLCMFLALAELEDPKNKLVVLDDVLGSVDEPHVERVVNMLYNVAGGFQHFVLTTHYKPWRELFRWGQLKNGECDFIELVKWSHAKGLQHSKSIPQVDQLRAMLAIPNPDPQDVCAKAGVILEAVLDFLTLLYRCRVPRQDGNYTLGDLLGALNPKLKASLQVDQLQSGTGGTATYITVQLGPIVEGLLKMAGARNVIGCHFNDLAKHMNDGAGITFGQLVLELADAIIDQEHGWPKSDRSGSYWSNKKETRKLHPLKQPM
ncbi:MAG: AAA family ATPase [Flavobacteriales bacterium]